ncbi:nickel transporter [Paraburkholderia sp. 1N]|uniref:Nickel transporter n=1 Tax=Paraburkholderia solitsugae TaxID=2675748 RepID=A0ABX2BHW8_9BURK|nr:HisA/HisF-related TIM barrel protein [Paraburkholderia solitsugae]NPT40399.1 nickel transporter [Paraburkholderia solitsugae]
MQIIPVIDVLNGSAVRAVRGERSRYQPVESQLCSGSDPVDIAQALLDYSAASVLYVADLDGIMRRAPQRDTLARLAHALPGIELWLDAGFTHPTAADTLITSLHEVGAKLTPVFGSESLRSDAASDVHADRSSLPSASPGRTVLPGRTPPRLPEDAILSLDRRHDTPLGDPLYWTDTANWPARLIVMTLERVGSFDGPDLTALADVRRRAGKRQIIGAGGVRHTDDLRAAAAAGADAWLIASALHDRRIPAASI